MNIGEVMSRGVEPIPPETSVQVAAVMMAEEDVGALLVGTEDAVEGILTDRDILLRVVVAGLSPASAQVRDVMSSTLFTCKQGDSVESAFQTMNEHQVRRLPVLDDHGRVVGIVTYRDLARQQPNDGSK